jgi:hypothetical protein
MENPGNDILVLSIKKFIFFILLTLVNFGLTVILVPIVGEKYLTYKQALIICFPVIILLVYFFCNIFVSYYRHTDKFNFIDLLKFVILIFDFLLLAFNIYLWIAMLRY